MSDTEGHVGSRDEVLSGARVVTAPEAGQFAIVVANAKGGCGKTTLSTSLAGGLAHRGRSVSLVDLDPQQSSTQWLEVRQRGSLPRIEGISLPAGDRLTYGRTIAALRGQCDYVVLDAPAGIGGQNLDTLLRVARVVLVPVLPSPIDIRATTRFLQKLMLSPVYRRHPRRLAVIANRVRDNSRAYDQLDLFLRSLKIPFLATVRDVESYPLAAGTGASVAELEHSDEEELRTWRTITDWLEVQRQLVRSMEQARASMR